MPFCPSCGAEVGQQAAVCLKCGVAVNNGLPNRQTGPVSDRDWIVTVLLAFFLGVFGVHRFYTGNIGIGVVQLLTLGGCGIWALIDFILILVGSYTDAEGRQLRR